LLRITLPQTLVVSPLGGLLARFQRKYPEVWLDVRVTSLQVDPVEEGFDLALRIGELNDSSLLARKIRDVRFRAVAAPRYRAPRRVRPSGAALARHTCLIYAEFGSRARPPWATGRACGKATARAGTRSTNSGVLLMNALLAGQGIAIGP